MSIFSPKLVYLVGAKLENKGIEIKNRVRKQLISNILIGDITNCGQTGDLVMIFPGEQFMALEENGQTIIHVQV